MSNNTPATDPAAEDWDEFEGTTTDAGHALAKYQGGQVLVSIYAVTAVAGKAGEVVVALSLEAADELAGVIRGAIFALGDEFAEDWDEWEGVNVKDGGHVLVQYEDGGVRIAGLDATGTNEAVLSLTALPLEEFADALEAAAGDPQD